MADIEEAAKNGEKPKDFIRGQISNKFGDRGRFQCVPQDHRGATLPQFAAWEENMEQDPENLEEMQEDEEAQAFMAQELSPQNYGTPPPPAGQPPPVDYSKIIADVQQISSSEYEKGEGRSRDTLALVMQMSQQAATSQMQNMQLMMQQQQAAQQQMMQMMVAVLGGGKTDAAERERQDRERQERERDRRNETLKWVSATVIPLLIPLLTKMTEKQQDLAMPLLLDMIKNGQNNNASKELVALMGEATKSQMQMQAEASKAAIAAAGESNKSVINHVLTMSQQVTQQMLDAAQGGGDGDDAPDMMDRFGKLMKILQPVLAAQSASPAPQVRAPAISPALIEAATHQPGQPQAPAPAPAAAPAQPPPDSEVVRACLYDILRLETNAIPAPDRVKCLAFWTTKLPQSMAAAIQAGQQDRIFEIAAPIVQSDPNLTAWFMTAGVPDYVEDSLKEMQRVYHKSMDAEGEKRSIAKHLDYIQKKGLVPLMTRPAPAAQPATKPAAPPVPPKKRGPPPMTEDTPVPAPVVEAPPADLPDAPPSDQPPAG
jgi:hypothetical protein